MQTAETKKDKLEKALLGTIDFYRGLVLDAVEQELGTSPNWKYLRSRLLKSLGDRGLSGRIREVLDQEFFGFENQQGEDYE